MAHGPKCPCDHCVSYRARLQQLALFKRFGLIALGFFSVFVLAYLFVSMAFPTVPRLPME